MKKRFNRFFSLLIAILVVSSSFTYSPQNIVQAAGDPVPTIQQVTPEYTQYLQDLQKGDTAKYGGIVPSATEHSLPMVGLKSFSAASLLSEYDPRSSNLLTPVKNQGSNGACWSFASTGALETLMSKTVGSKLDYSEEHMRFLLSNQNTNHSNFYYTRNPDDGGNFEKASTYFTNWQGPVSEADVPYRTSTGQSWPANMNTAQNQLHVTGTKIIGKNDIKDSILQNGSVYASIWAGDGINANSLSTYYNASNKALYYNGTNTNHAVLLVGWNDNYPATNFNTNFRPSSNGAWLVKNSWGTSFGDGGYFWLSYEDKALNSKPNYFAITGARTTSSNEKMLSYDYIELNKTLSASVSTFSEANVFDLTSDYNTYGTVTDIMYYSSFVGSQYELYIVPATANGAPPVMTALGSPVATGTVSYEGYVTVTLPTPYTIPSAGKYAFILKLKASAGQSSLGINCERIGDPTMVPTIKTGESYYSTGSEWKDITTFDGNTGNVCLRPILRKQDKVAVTGVSLDQKTKTITTGSSFQLTATVAPTNATNKNVSWKTSNPAVANVDQITGKVTGVASGSAAITATTEDGGKTDTCIVTVDDYGNDIASAYNWTLTGGTTNSKNGNLEVTNDVDMFKFTAPVTGSYTFYSTNRVPDVKGWLYNSSGTELTNNDDGNGDLNFKITYDLVQGQVYYLKVSHYAQNGAGTYTVNVNVPAANENLGLIKDVFPDPILAQEIAGQLGKMVNDVYTKTDAGKITKIFLYYTGISDATGIETLSNLVDLTIGVGNLTTIDVSKNVKLINLNLYRNQLKTLDVSSNPELINLNAHSNQFTTIDLSKNVKLTNLTLSSNQLKMLNVSSNPELLDLSVDSNQLTAINVSKNVKLRSLAVSSNQLQTLNTNSNPELLTLQADSNQLTAIDVSKNVKLSSLYVSSNQLQTLNTNSNPELLYLNARYNQLTTVDVSKNAKLTNLFLDSNQLKILNVSFNPELNWLTANSNQLTMIDVIKNVKLTNLSLNSNQLKTINIGSNIELGYIYLDSNQLTAIDFSKNVKLTYFAVRYNQLTKLDLSMNSKLSSYHYEGNPIVTIIKPLGQ